MFWGGQGGVIGSVIVPFNEHYAAQFDATVSGIYPGVSPGLAGHLYWADTKKGLLGLYGSGNFMTGADGGGNMQFGAEGAVFLDRFTIQGIAGVEGQSMDQASPGYSCQAVGNAGCYAAYDPKLGVGLYDAYGNPMPNVSRGLFQVPRVFDHVEFGYYATEDFKLYLAHEYTGGLHSGDRGSGVTAADRKRHSAVDLRRRQPRRTRHAFDHRRRAVRFRPGRRQVADAPPSRGRPDHAYPPQYQHARQPELDAGSCG